MEITSTPLKKKTVKLEKPSRRIIDNILKYSRSLVMVPNTCGQAVLLINN